MLRPGIHGVSLRRVPKGASGHLGCPDQARPFPICSKCRLMVHHGCLAQTDPPVCRRCAAPAPEPKPS